MPSCAHLEATPLTPLPADFEPYCLTARSTAASGCTCGAA